MSFQVLLFVLHTVCVGCTARDFREVSIETGNGGKPAIKTDKGNGVVGACQQPLGAVDTDRGYVMVKGNPHFLMEKLAKMRGVVARVLRNVV